MRISGVHSSPAPIITRGMDCDEKNRQLSCQNQEFRPQHRRFSLFPAIFPPAEVLGWHFLRLWVKTRTAIFDLAIFSGGWPYLSARLFVGDRPPIYRAALSAIPRDPWFGVRAGCREPTNLALMCALTPASTLLLLPRSPTSTA